MPKSPAQLDAEIAAELRAPVALPSFEKFSRWADVLDAARRGDTLWYQAPLDYRPVSIRVVRVFKNGKIRIDPMSRDADSFTADAHHLDRFRRRA